MEAMKLMKEHTRSTICALSGKRLNSPQIGLQSSVPFSSKKKPSEHTNLLGSWLSELGMSWPLKSDILFVTFERAVHEEGYIILTHSSPLFHMYVLLVVPFYTITEGLEMRLHVLQSLVGFGGSMLYVHGPAPPSLPK